MNFFNTASFVLMISIITGCTSVYYNSLEKVGIHKRDILIDRVEDTRDAQTEAQDQFESALEKFGSVVEITDSDLKAAYEALNQEYEDSKEVAEEVSSRISSVESVAEDLFEEWADEITQYKNKDFRRSSTNQLKVTQSRYKKMLASMHKVEKSMEPVLATFKDNVLFLKHNLNAQAIGSLKSEFSSLKDNIAVLVKQMNQSILRSDEFIKEMRK